MKKLIKWLFKLVFLVAGLAGLLLLFRNPIVRALVERELRNATGMDVFVGKINAGVFSPVIQIENLRLFNPPHLDRGLFADLPDVYLEYDRDALFHRELKLRALRLNLFEVHFVRAKDGTTNFRLLQERAARRRAGPRARTELEFRGIDVLTLTLGRFRYTDHQEPSRSDELWLGVRNARINPVRSTADLEPFLVKLALEKNLKTVFDRLFGPADKAAFPPAPAPVRAPRAPEAPEPAR